MRLILFRHGQAEGSDPARWPDDRLRPLTERGIRRTRDAANGLMRLQGEISRIVSSPIERAAQTAAILREAYEMERDVEHNRTLALGGPLQQLLEAIPETGDEAVVLVGHEPHLGKLAGTLLFGAPRPLAMKKAGACAIDFDGPPRAGAGKLAWFVPPRVLRQLARKQRARA